MGSSKGHGREDGSKRRDGDPRRRRQGRPRLEFLENRRLLAGVGTNPGVTWHPTSTDPYDVQNGPLANLGKDLIQVYHDFATYSQAGDKGTFTSSRASTLFIQGTSVGVDIRGYGDFASFQQSLKTIGVTVLATDARLNIVEGNIPIAALPQLASLSQLIGANPIYRPVAFQQGRSPNQSDATLGGPAIRATYGVDGTGQKIGVISTSVNNYNGGLAASVASGDLPNNVQVLQDALPSIAADDEGRAMLEQIHDIAPGASLAFATGFNGEVSFMQNIEALYAAGARTIVDDLGYFDDPYYQQGIISQGIDQVVSQGAAYFSSVGNASDSGYESQFRGVNATVGPLGAGRYMNFDPTGATTTTSIGINVYTPASISLQFDQPYYSRTGGVVSNIELDVLNANGTLVSQANTNTIANQQPFQITPNDLPAGLYQVVIKVDAGPDPGHVVFYENGDGGFSVDRKFGSAGNTFYPSTHGHNSDSSTISVGAVPFWGAAPYTNPATVTSEPFSSTGPVLKEFAFDGTPITPTLLQKPDISGTDGNNTTFFSPGPSIDTSRPVIPATPPYPGNPPTTFAPPVTATNQVDPTLPSFFGTSSAAPNVAAIAALIRAATPNITEPEIASALISTATPLNGAARGTYNPQGGFGLVNGPAAVRAASVLAVASISPGGGATIASAPTSITVTFNKPVVLSTISAGSLVFNTFNGARVTVGNPVGVDSATTPTVVSFPITITPTPGQIANGVYFETVLFGGIRSQDGQTLATPLTTSFNLQQVAGARVTATALNGRFLSITFNEPLNPSSINSNFIFLYRSNGNTASPLINPQGIAVSQLSGAIYTYNPTNFTVTIDLSALPQSSLPSDHYAIYVSANVTDAVGNRLNGSFNGVFPSGTSQAGVSSDFVQDLGFIPLPAPLVSFVALAPQSDSGIVGDLNTNVATPSFNGQLTARFPSGLAGLTVYAEFNGIGHPGVARGGLDLNVGAGGPAGNGSRGFTGHFDVQTTTNARGQFTINYPAGLPPLPEGENRLRIVVVGQPDSPPFPGLSTLFDTAFRIDQTLAYVGNPDGSQATSIPENANINSLTALSVNVLDPVNPTTLGDPFAVDPRLAIPPLNPVLAANTANYRLFRVIAPGNLVDESSFIKTATFTSTSARVLSSDPLTGRIDLTFGPGLPQGRYFFDVLTSALGPGLTDAAGNPFGGYQSTAQTGKPTNFQLDFNLQPTPTYITAYTAYSTDPSTGATTTTGPRSDYEIPLAGVTPRAPAAPTQFTIDFSNPLSPLVDYSRDVLIARSADSPTAKPDGNFGDFGITNSTGFTPVTGLTVQLENSVQGATFGQYGFENRLLITVPAGSPLPADYYRVYLPNNGPTAIFDQFGSQLDGEFLGNQDATGKYVDLLPNGTTRGSSPSDVADLSGDGTPGGAFMTGFVVVPNGNVIFARPDALFNPQIPSQVPNGSPERPYPVLAPEAVPNPINGGDLNSTVNSGANFNPIYDRAGLGAFQPSAFFAAQQLVLANAGPVVILAEPSVLTVDPSGNTIQRPFVLQAPAGSDPIANDASASVPALTTLVFEAGSALKMQNAALLVQNQGSALQVLGGPNTFQQVNVTSYKDASVGGVTNGDPNSAPAAGDYGGIVFRDFSQAAIPGSAAARTSLFPGQIPTTGVPSVDNRLKSPLLNPATGGQADAISGADDILSYVNFLVEKYAGGPVPQTNGVRYDGITIQGARPTITNSVLSFAGGAGSAQAGLSVDVDALRRDDVAQGTLLRADQFINNGLNGIYIRAAIASGIAEPTNAVFHAANPTSLGGSSNFVLNDPYPYLLTTRLVIGQQLLVETGGAQGGTADRLYVDPGMVLKFEHGAALQVLGGSINVGDQTYIREYDANHNVGPTFGATLPNGQPNPQAGQINPNFVANSAGLSKAIFTSLNDDAATSTYFDPISQTTTTIVAPLPAVPGGSGALQPTPGRPVDPLARWGGVELASGSVGVINGSIIRYGSGAVNTATGTGFLNALSIDGGGAGARLSLTNNIFDDNADVAVNLNDNALLAGDPQRPLLSGNPFIHGNLFLNNQFNGVGVAGGGSNIQPVSLNHDSVWTGSDFTYILRSTIVVGPPAGFTFPTAPIATSLQPIPTAAVTLTLQSTLAGTILADGTTVAAPGVPLLIKELGGVANEVPGVTPAANRNESFAGGAGFIVGVDDGIDPPQPFPEYYVDGGALGTIRILGVAANQSTGQTRVPVIITSVHDNTVGTTVNGVAMFNAMTGDTTTPQAGDGGLIYYGGNSLTSYNLQDPRNGPVIDNADIRYITRIEQQGDGLLYAFDLTGGNALTPSYNTKLGLPGGNNTGFASQYNAPKALTISDSNLYDFSDAGVISHPGYGSLLINVNYPNTGSPRSTAFLGEPTHLYLVNDTITGMTHGQATGVEIISETSDNVNFPSPAEAVFLNDTFDNNGIGINAVGQPANGVNSLSHVAFLAMDSIFSNIGLTTNGAFVPGNAVQGSGQLTASDLQYNLFYNVASTQGVPNTPNVPNDQPIVGNPAYRAGTYFLTSSSAAIDRARSELGPSFFGDMLLPADTVDPNNLNALPIRNTTGDINGFGGIPQVNGVPAPSDNDIVTLPGEPVTQRGFPDIWTAVLQGAVPGYTSTSNLAGTYAYVPLAGERDQLGNLRVKDPNSPNVGFGSRPFFDIGAFEYIIQNPPVVTAVSATVPNSTNPINLYNPGGIAGTNQPIQSINIRFNEQVDPNTITANSVILLASGGDGIFGNGNSPADRAINLAGDLSFNPTTDILTINTSGIFTNAALLNDEYELILKGTGSNVIKDRNGLVLDGFTANGTLPLPSGSDNFPGSDFLVNFTIDNHPPALVNGSFHLAPSSDTSGGKSITRNATPTFVGSITDVFPPVNPLLGAQVFVDISTRGDGNFDDIAAATGTTDANGNFSVTVRTPLPNSPYVVGPTGMQMLPGDAGFTQARVRIVNQAGNASATLNTPLQTFISTGAFAGFEVDTTPPRVTSITPTANVLANGNASGAIPVTVTFSKNINPATLNANTIQVFRAGGTGTFNGTGVQVPINPNSIQITYLHTPKGAISVTFTINGPLPNDLYRVVLKGTGTAPITDIAGNALDGAGTGTPGTDFVNGPFIVFSQANARLIYVDNNRVPIVGATQPAGSRANPYPTIAAGLAAALTGDDVLVLPGTYRGDIVLKAQVRLLSADPSSTDTAFTPGSPENTFLYGSTTAINPTTVLGSSIAPLAGLTTEVSGFSIIAPLLGDPIVGPIDPTSSAVGLMNASVLVDKNFIINGAIGVNVATTGNAATPQIIDNLIAGNITGIGISDTNSTISLVAPVAVDNNTIADNTIGLYNTSLTANSTQASVFNNIFYANHELTPTRLGTGIFSQGANTLNLGANLFYQNGTSNLAGAQAVGTFAALTPSALTATPDAHGNFLANPSFITPRDPRPNGDTPPVFYLEGNYDLSTRSPAINMALQAVAPPTDILYRTPVAIPGHGSPLTGPASIGAYYPLGTGGIPVTTGGGTRNLPVTGGTGGTVGIINGGGRNGTVSANALAVSAGPLGGGSLAINTKRFDVVTTSLSADGTRTAAGQAGGIAYLPAPSSIVIDFSDDINGSTLSPSDLKLSGSGLGGVNPARVTGLNWVDRHTIEFFLTGSFNSTGTVNLSIPQGALTDTKGDALEAFTDSFRLGNAPVTTTTATAPTTTLPNPPTTATAVLPPSASAPLQTATVLTSFIQPVAVTGPIAVHYASTSATKSKTKATTHPAAPSKAAPAHPAPTPAHPAAPAKAAKPVKVAKPHKAK